MNTITRKLLIMTAVLFAGCTTALSSRELVIVSADDDQLYVQQGGNTRPLAIAEGEIEAVAGNGNWLMWVEGENASLLYGQLRSQQLDPMRVANLPHDVDGLCFAPIGPGLFDVFASDGDGGIYHYWLNTADQSLQPVRRLTTNPDIERCQLTGDELLLSDPYLGPLSVDRNPENDGILRLAKDLTAQQRQQLKSTDYRMVGEALTGLSEPALPSITADIETQPVEAAGDAADDAVVLAAKDGDFWLVGTDKKRGLLVYDRTGQQQHFLPEGRLNNVDALALGEDRFLLAASNRTHKSIDLFVADLGANTVVLRQRVPLAIEEPYGLCMGRDPSGQALVFVGDPEGHVESWLLAKNQVSRRDVFNFDSQTEGCVYDGQAHQLYVGEEDVGIWRVDIGSGSRDLVASVAQGHLAADVEGLDIYSGEQRWLIASSQGDDSYVAYSLAPWRYVAKFQIGPDYARGLDGVSETDGLAISAAALEGFPRGALVVQDGRNRAPQQPQNFKLVDWRKVEALLTERR